MMSSNNHALIRYRTIDRCLKSKSRNFFLRDLINECSDQVHEYEEHKTGKKKAYKSISRRTLLYDLKFMKDEEYGFSAPIEHDPVDGYFYSDPTFEIFKARISKPDLERLADALNILKQLSGESQFHDLQSMVIRLEENYQIKTKAKDSSIVQFEHSTNIEGQKWVTKLKQYVNNRTTLNIKYKPFGGQISIRTLSPYLIKEYNNRWFLIGFDHGYKKISNLGLDRIQNIDPSILGYHMEDSFDRENYLKNVVGVSIPEAKSIETIIVKAIGNQQYYLKTKPMHASQECIESNAYFGIFKMTLIPNFELESRILANSDTIEVIKPEWFKRRIIDRIQQSLQNYAC